MTAFVLIFFQSFISIFVIVNPIGILPVVLSLTSDMKPLEKASAIRKSCITAFVVLLVTAIGGGAIFSLFQITLGALRIAGGIFLFILSISMLYGRHTKAKVNDIERKEFDDDDEDVEDVAITPLGIPVIVGPGAITVTMGLMEQAHTSLEIGALFLAITLAIFTTFILLRGGSSISKYMGKSGLRTMTRIMGLVVSVIAVQFVINGISDALPQILGKQ